MKSTLYLIINVTINVKKGKVFLMDISVQTFTCRLEDYSSPKLQHCKGLFSKHSHSDLLNYNQQASNCELKFENILMKKGRNTSPVQTAIGKSCHPQQFFRHGKP